MKWSNSKGEWKVELASNWFAGGFVVHLRLSVWMLQSCWCSWILMKLFLFSTFFCIILLSKLNYSIPPTHTHSVARWDFQFSIELLLGNGMKWRKSEYKNHKSPFRRKGRLHCPPVHELFSQQTAVISTRPLPRPQTVIQLEIPS